MTCGCVLVMRLWEVCVVGLQGGQTTIRISPLQISPLRLNSCDQIVMARKLAHGLMGSWAYGLMDVCAAHISGQAASESLKLRPICL